MKRKSYWRIAATFAWMLQGILAPWSQMPAYAQNPDTIRIGVRTGSLAPPVPVNDLLASPNLVVPSQVSLSWTAPEGYLDIPGAEVAHYSVHYATFSIDSLSGNTTSWWNATMASSTTLQAPAFPPQSPGSLEAYTFTGLSPATTYFFAIRSTGLLGTLSDIDTNAAAPGQQAMAVTAANPSSTSPPDQPNGILGTLSSAGTQFTLTWHAVTRAVNGDPIVIDHYVVERSTALLSTPNQSIVVPAAGALSFNETVNNQLNYYRIRAVTAGALTSEYSDYIDSSLQVNRIVLANGDTNSRLTIPRDVAVELVGPSNAYGQDLKIVAIRRMQDETTNILRSYLFRVQVVATGVVVPNFSFSQSLTSVQVGFDINVPALGLNGTPAGAGGNAAAIAQVISLYWFNGSDFIRVGGTVVTSGQALSVSARNLGIYQIRVVSLGTRLTLTRGSPYPRVITPNDPSQNNRVFFFLDNPLDEQINGTIYDLRGAKVRDLQVTSQSPTSNSLVWDGRDNQGAVVPSGIYLYKITAGSEKVTGTVVVAR